MKVICRSIGKPFPLRDSSEFIKMVSDGNPIGDSLITSFKGVSLSIKELGSQYVGVDSISNMATESDVLVLQGDIIYKFISLEGINAYMRRIGYLLDINSNKNIKLFVKEGEKLINKKPGEKVIIMNRYFSDTGIYLMNKVNEKDNYSMCISATTIDVEPLEEKNKEYLLSLLSAFDSSVYKFKLEDKFIDAIQKTATLLTATKITESGEEIIQYNPVIYYRGFKIFDIPHII